MTPIEVHEAPSDAFQSLARSLARAFERDPVIEFLFPRQSSRISRASKYYLLVLQKMARIGVIYTDASRQGVSVWKSPDPPDPARNERWATALGVLRMAATLRESSLRARVLARALEAVSPREPHWHLDLLATDPEHQRQGVGSALLQPVLGRCDAAGVPAWLETDEANVSFYDRHGFEVMKDILVPRGPRLLHLRRAPRH